VLQAKSRERGGLERSSRIQRESNRSKDKCESTVREGRGPCRGHGTWRQLLLPRVALGESKRTEGRKKGIPDYVLNFDLRKEAPWGSPADVYKVSAIKGKV